MTSSLMDTEVQRLRSARDSVAVSKLELIGAMTRCPGIPILVVEGPDDKLVYSQWIRRIRNELSYEFYVAKGKRQTLALLDAIRRDKTGLEGKIFFFIDRDFDDLGEHEPSKYLFMTDMYSIENYLVDENLLDDVLSVEFHCNGHPELRKIIRKLFTSSYESFLEVTKEFNFRLFLSKAIPINRSGSFPERINQIAIVSLDTTQPQIRPITEVIDLEREPIEAEITIIRPLFDALNKSQRYRGKFSLLFFNKWIDLLVEDYSSKNTKYFSEIEENQRARRQELVLSSLASRSAMPAALGDFLATI